MKKLYKKSSWIEASERRRRKIERRRQTARKKTWWPSAKIRRNAQLPQVDIEAGKRLDPMDSASETVKVCAQIRDNVSRGEANVFVNLRELESFTLAGVILLSASIKAKRMRNANAVRVSGNLPKDPSVASDFLASGFFDKFRNGRGKLPQPTAQWTSASQQKVASEKAAELVEFADREVGLTVEQQRAVSQNLVECMTNTTNHASGKDAGKSGEGGNRDTKEWIAGVRCEGKQAQFAFVDLGVGICASARATGFLRQARQTLTGYGAARLVQESFDGTLGSSTKLQGRGLGLPRMRTDCRRGLLKDLTVCTGKVRGKIQTMEFEDGQDKMKGTILTWFASGGNAGG